uniref:Andersonin-M2 peptide n=1 Tax=Odorrana andersonii TaxID=369514 RepID=E3SZP9_ODOAN|nr:andersonin-M2 peptide precursor [Odorrana andersonii]
MFTLKKPLLVLFFLGTISLSLCEQERDADEEEGSENGAEDIKQWYQRRVAIYGRDLRSDVCRQVQHNWLVCDTY